MARQFNQIPPICEQAEYHMFQREKVEVQLPDLFQKIGKPLCLFLKPMTHLQPTIHSSSIHLHLLFIFIFVVGV